jgi:hypothetical protein
MDPSITLVLSRYKENIEWLQSLKNDSLEILVYNKFYKSESNYLPNVGREGHTYLYHIINNYNKLSEYTVFCQGHPFDHYPNFIDLINDYRSLIDNNLLVSGFYPIGNIIYEGPYANFHERHICGLPMFYFFELLFDIHMKQNDRYDTSYGAQFIVHRDNVQSRPIEFYQLLLKTISFEANPIEVYVLERLWPYIFNKKLPLSDKILSLMGLPTNGSKAAYDGSVVTSNL